MSSFDDLFKIQQRIQKLYKPILQSINMDAFIMASNTLAKPAVDIAVLQATHPMQESLANFTKSIQASMSIDYSKIVNISETMQTIIKFAQPNIKLINTNISETMQTIAKSAQPNIKLINTNMSVFMRNYTDMISGLNSIGYNLSELVQQACDEIEDEEFIEDDFSSNEEIVEILQEQVDNPKSFQERVADWSEAKKKKYYILIGIIIFIWTNFFQPYFQDTIGKPVVAYTISKVKELPKAAGKVIDELKKDFQAIVTEDVPYYYKVTYTDENGNTKEGYVAKKNLKIIEDEEATDKDVENEE